MYYVDSSYRSLIKYGEELCGDNVEQASFGEYKLIVLSDGLGSGVKANILATLTSKIAVTMLKDGVYIEDVIETIAKTLPVCSEREIAYSTFTMIKAKSNGHVYVAEFDGPPIFLHKDGKDIPVEKTCREIYGKTVYESSFFMDEGMELVVISDGVINASEGMILNYDWTWDDVNDFLRIVSMENGKASEVCTRLMDVCQSLYDDKPGDDTTVIAIKMCRKNNVDLIIGPPAKTEDDTDVMSEIFRRKSKKIVCGGTTSNIVARVLGKEMTIDTDTMTDEIPPMGYIDGVDLVVEGVVTISNTVKLIQRYLDPVYSEETEKRLKEKNGAALLADMLINECSDLTIWMGTAVNPAHIDVQFMRNFNYKESKAKELKELLEKMGKKVTFNYT